MKYFLMYNLLISRVYVTLFIKQRRKHVFHYTLRTRDGEYIINYSHINYKYDEGFRSDLG